MSPYPAPRPRRHYGALIAAGIGLAVLAVLSLYGLRAATIQVTAP